MKFDDVISELGDFGPYQKRLYFLVCLVGIPAVFQTMSTVFIQATPDHRCAVPGLDNDTYASQGPWHDAAVNASVPWNYDEDNYDECTLWRVPGEQANETVSCDRWVYSEDPFKSTFVSDDNLVCDRKELVTYSSMVLMAGMLVGSLVMGILSDMFGRKKILLLGTIGQLGSGLGVAMADSYIMFVTMRFLVTFFGVGMFMSAFVIGMELVGPSKRRIAGIVIELFWCAGLFLQTGIAYGIREWKIFQMVICIPNVITAIVLFFLLPESPRWLIQKGRINDAIEIIQTVAQKNGVVLSKKARSLEDLELDGEGEQFWHMFTSRTLVIRFSIIFLNWVATSMVYFGLSLNTEALSGDIYFNFFLQAVMELVAYVFCLVYLDKAGRKFLLCFSMVVGGIACISTMFPVIFGDGDDKWITNSLSLVGKFGGSAGFAVVYIYSAELFPTVMRSSGIGACSLVARIGGVLAPYIGGLNKQIPGHLGTATPLLIFGGISALAGALVMFLPETSNRILPETVEDAKNFGKKHTNSKTMYNIQTAPTNSVKGNTNPGFQAEQVL